MTHKIPHRTAHALSILGNHWITSFIMLRIRDSIALALYPDALFLQK